MRRHPFLAAVTAGALLSTVLWAPVATADTVGPAPEPASMTLFASLTLTADHFGNIVIAADDVTLDCAGHAVIGPAYDELSGGIEIAGVSGVTVRNCVITGFLAQNGIFGYGSEIRLEHNTIFGNANHGIHLDSVSDTTIEHNTIRDNGVNGPSVGIILTRSTAAAVRSNTISGQAWGGIAMVQGTTSSKIIDNTVTGSGSGIILNEASDGNVLRGNTTNKNGHGFTILASSMNTFEDNTANHNTYIGFQVDGNAGPNTFTGNTANANNDGFNLLGVNGNTLVGNTANKNRHAGFLVWGGASDNTLTDNTGLNNAWFDAYDEGTGTGNTWHGNTFRVASGF